MGDRCAQELCPNWSGEGNVCPCAVLGLEPPTAADNLDVTFWHDDEEDDGDE